jgi:hypothetical protein
LKAKSRRAALFSILYVQRIFAAQGKGFQGLCLQILT